ncbi:diacylglycerol kinase family protein [uncultured Brevundimonas sp.]|uniref:diacylglycerol/lipid kinase family protein n=1 Tax=uncultured Brevundimonas sp. TaxID=213418 RepID=UPI0030ED06F1|tara:strand:+ start:526 stop:1512 length:987 start_codon:yes stop_codon:yes gene_type:complete
MSEILIDPTATTAADFPAESGSAAALPVLTAHVALKRLIMLVNPLSGGVDAEAVAEATAILADYDCESSVIELNHEDFEARIDEALAAAPDVLIVLAGDGTAGTIASRAGPDGPLIAPLPGGTMNMLPRALYDTADWKVALRLALEQGAAQSIAGGEISDADGQHTFYCAAILGSAALWAPAREAIRTGQMKLAWVYARRALRRAFGGRLRYALDGVAGRQTEALVLISPTISRAIGEDAGLEAAAMNPADAVQAMRLAAHALFTGWRQDPSVRTTATRNARVRARSRIPAVIDGEPTLLRHEATIRYIPEAFRALAPNRPAVAEDAA